MSKHFTNLHLHTEFSLLDGAIALDKLIDFGKAHNFKSLAITDHGNVFGAVKFFEKCKKAKIKPILGIESYFTEDITVKSADNKYYHLILLVQNVVGYRNLCKLIAHAYQDGFYFKPRIDYRLLEKYSEGLIVLTACLGGHIPKLLMQQNFAEAEKRIDWFTGVFGKDRFFFEVQPEDQTEQIALNKLLYEWGAKKDIKLVATSDAHYVSPEDRQAHEVMLSIQTHAKLTDTDRFTFGDVRAHIRTETEMLATFPDKPEMVYQSGEIADRCDFDFKNKLFFPKFEIPETHTPETYFKYLCMNGLDQLLATGRIEASQEAVYRKRLDDEVTMISTMGFVGYFLVVSDFIQWAKRNGIPVGPGRGSAAGSLVAWSLEITNIDPIKYNLLFERFLNPERVSMPDIDIDFCIEGRERVIQYVRDKYGHDKVCQIITFGTMMAKGVVKDVARVLGIPFEDSNMLTSLIPEQLKISLTESLEKEPKLKELIAQNPKISQLFDLAFRLEGLTRHASKHAAGIVISPESIDEVLPVYVPPKTTELVTQYAMTELETLGFLKIDLLGLKNLTLIDRCLKMLAKNRGIHLDIDRLPLDDAKTFALVGAGTTSGVFQLESDGLKEVLRRLKPDKFEDIIAVNALYRPGPLGSGMVEDYIERRHGRQKVTYIFDELAPVLEETYGVIVYQEQVMKIASVIAGYSLGEADILRRAMGKKKAEEMAKQRAIFIEKSIARKFDEKKAGELFDLMAYFAGYGFNKSHSAAYALIAYQTAYLKAHFPAEFMACLVSLEASDSEKMAFYLQESKDLGLAILPPDINHSDVQFTVVDGKLLFGLQGVKNVGLASLENILSVRVSKPFIDLLDFCKRIDLRTSNKRVIENLICAGAFDTLPGSRAQKHQAVEAIIERATAHKEAVATGQMGLFGVADPQADVHEAYEFAPIENWDAKTSLEKEKEVVGFYLSAHPFDSYKNQVRWLNIPTFAHTLANQQQSDQEPVVLGCGIVKNSKTIFTKKNERMAFVTLEDAVSKAEIILFPSVFAKVEQWLSSHQIFVVKGALDVASAQQCKIKAQEFVPLDLVYEQWPIAELQLTMPEIITPALLEELQKQLPQGNTPLSFIVSEGGKQLRLKTKQKVATCAERLELIEKNAVNVSLII
jgi:DNA polymerase III subunit alpha